MSLADLIRKKESTDVATAIHAIAATDGQTVEQVTVARIATVAVASPMETKTANAATQAEAAELRRLITACATELVGAGRTVEGYGLLRTGYRDGWTAAEVEEALRVALADVDAALTCWRLLAPVRVIQIDGQGKNAGRS